MIFSVALDWVLNWQLIQSSRCKMTQLGEQQFCRYAWEKRGLIRKSREGHFDKSPILRRDSNLQRSRCWRNRDLVWGTFQLPLWQICVGLENHSAKLQIRDFILTRAPDLKLSLHRSPDWPGHEAEQRGGAEVGLPGRHPHRAGGARHQDGGEGWRHQRGR